MARIRSSAAGFSSEENIDRADLREWCRRNRRERRTLRAGGRISPVHRITGRQISQLVKCSRKERAGLIPPKTSIAAGEKTVAHRACLSTFNALAMIIITKTDATEEQIQHIVERIKEWGLKAEISRGALRVVIGVIGPEDLIREKPLAAIPGVDSVTPVLKPYKLVSYEFRGTPSLVRIGDVEIGGKQIVVMSGPCSVESREQITAIARDVKSAGARDTAWRRVQAAHLSLHLPGAGGRWAEAARRSEG